jgi:hypothetical protein
MKAIIKKHILPTFRNIFREFKNNNGFKMIGGELELTILRRLVKKNAIAKNECKSILFYPHFPSYGYVIYNICRILGYKMTNDCRDKFYLAVNWQDSTYKIYDDILMDLIKSSIVLNSQCKNIDKRYIDSIFKEVFGHSIMINPLSYKGACVMKSNLNGQHDGRVIQCPVDKIDENCVYQKVINNKYDDTLVQDIRVPIFKNSIPFLYLKYRPIQNRFSNTNTETIIAEVHKIFSNGDLEKIFIFCKKIGLDYGELDILRDENNKLLYIVDVNNTPFGPPNHISKPEKQLALKLMAKTFEDVFMTN